MDVQKQFSCFLVGEGTLPIQCAEVLLRRGHQIFGVISPDASISSWAKGKDIPCIHPTDNLVAFLSQRPFDYLFSIVNDSVLPKEILALPRQLTINYHDAALPKYAGVNATSWALMHREKTHGVTWHIMSDLVDGGDVLKQIAIDIADGDTAFTLKCYEAAIRSFEELVDELSRGQALASKQNLDERTYFGRSKRLLSGSVVSFNCCAYDLEADIRALNFGPYPNALGLPKLSIGSDLLIIQKLEVKDDLSKSLPGTITAIETSFLTVSTASYEVALHQVLTIDGQALSISDLVERFGLQVGYQFKDIEPDSVRRIERFDGLIARHVAFWVEKLATLQPITVPYTDRTASHSNQKQYTSVKMFLPHEVITFLEERHPAWNQGDFLFAAFAIYLARIGGTGCFDIGFRDVELQRELVGLESFFASLVSCRVDVDYEQSFEEAFKTFREQVALTRLHKTYARDVVARYPALRSLPELSREPMFPVVVERVDKLGDHQARSGNQLTLVIPSEGKECCWLYNTEALDGDSIARMLEQFTTLLQGIVTDPKGHVAYLPLLSEQERHKILVEWNDTEADYPKDKCIHQLFEAQVERTPDAIAVVFENQQMTYQELNCQANQLAHHLKSLGVGTGTFVGVYLDRTLEMIPALLGILKAGGAYVPLETSFPKARVQWILSSLDVRALVTQQLHLHTFDDLQPQLPTLEHLICLDTATVEETAELLQVWRRSHLCQQPESNLPRQSSSTDTAYIIFTSGSTGTPKGVVVRHKPVINLIEWVNKTFNVNTSDRVLFITSLCFDLSVYDIFGLLAAGGSIRVVSSQDVRDPNALLHILCNEPITFWDSAPPALQQLVPFFPKAKLSGGQHPLRLVFMSGDWIPITLPDLVKSTFPGVEVISLGGATEATVWSNFYRIDEIDPTWVSIPYGKPIQNTQYYILSANANPCPIGVPGELYIGGECLASGYTDPVKTDEKFISNPFSQVPQARLYRTGDLACFLPDGNIQFLGRIDHQVKIRGFRIELGEIETVLRQHPAVRESVVLAREDEPGNKRLVAYIALQRGEFLNASKVRRFLQTKLPEYMVPSAIMFLEALPLTANGKVDRRALPAPVQIRKESEETFVAPRNELELQLTKIWEKVLVVHPISVKDNFFGLGGHSMLAAHLVTQIEKGLGRNLPLANLFQAPTIEELAGILSQEGYSLEPKKSVELESGTNLPNRSGSPSLGSSLIAIQPNGSKPPLFCIHVLGRGLKFYRPLAHHLGLEQPLYGLAAQIMDKQYAPPNRVEDLAAHYIEPI